jgi:xanthine dehydrogenase accessory factor
VSRTTGRSVGTRRAHRSAAGYHRDMVEVYRALLTVLDSGESAAICTVVESAGSSPQKIGSKLLVREDGSTVGTIGGGAVELAAVSEAREVLGTGQARLFKAHLARDLAMCCGGRMEVFIEPVGDRPWLLLFGGGHIGASLCEVASLAGFRVHVIDEREEFSTSERHPRATKLTCAEPQDVIGDLPWGPQTFAVVVTHSHRQDEEILARCTAMPRRYLGMIGSRSKVRKFLDRYEQRGLDKTALAGVRAPVGLDIAAREPGEIAVAIVAEMVAVRRGAGEREAFGIMRLEPLQGS